MDNEIFRENKGLLLKHILNLRALKKKDTVVSLGYALELKSMENAIFL